MRRSPLRKIGKTGESNRKARAIIAQIAEEKGLNYCEVRFDGCMRTWPLSPAHRHSRSWYQGDVDKLSDFQQWLSCCQACHTKLDGRATVSQEESDEIFNRLRGEE